jgi:hypothetical protein
LSFEFLAWKMIANALFRSTTSINIRDWRMLASLPRNASADPANLSAG